MTSKGSKSGSKRASLRDVAEMAGVSLAAVSYVVNGRNNEVSQETQLRIKEAIAVLRYQPQRRGLSLRLNREFSIGLVIVDPDPGFLADPFTTYVATGLSNALLEPGYAVTITGCRNREDLVRYLGRPVGVDGYVVLASGPTEERREIYTLLSSGGLPVLVVQDEVPNDLEDGCAVMQEDGSGAAQLCRLLIDRGSKNLLWIAPIRPWPAIERRLKGIKDTLPEGWNLATLECNELDFEATTETIRSFLDRNPKLDGIIGANDQIAISALRVLSELGISVPQSVQLTGYNDFTFRQYVSPSITTVSSNALEIGRKCADVLLQRLENGSFVQRSVCLDVKLKVGETTR